MAISNAYAQATPPGNTPAIASVAAADDAAPVSPAAEPAAGAALQEVKVTATRRFVNLQKVASTVNVVSNEALNNLNVLSPMDVQGLVPGLAMVRSGGVVPFVRGVGTNNSGFTTETPVGIYIDGLYLANSASGMFSFNNIERIEVLKGPQGTLYGRNTTGGLIHVITRDPEEKTHVDASYTRANYNTNTVNFYGSTPLGDTLSMNIALSSTDQGQGWGRNVVTGNDNLKSRESGAQLKLLWRPMPGTRVTLRAFSDYSDSDQGFWNAIVPGMVGNDGTGYLGEYRNAARRDNSVRIHQANGALKVEQDVGFANLLSITGYQHNTSPVSFTQNAIPGKPTSAQSAIEVNLFGENKTFSQELQLSSKPSPSPLDWIAGAFYYDDDTVTVLDTFGTCVGTVCAAAPVPNRVTGRPTTKSSSIYADGNYKVADATRLTLGVRYTQDKKGLSGLAEPLAGLPNTPSVLPASLVLHPGDPYPGNPAGIPTEVSFSKVTFRAVVAQDFTKNINGYLSFNRGFKAGGYNSVSFSNPVSSPEILDAIELGMKSELLNRRLRLNVSAFNYQYTDIQLRSTAPPAPAGGNILFNAAGARVNGLDADFKAVVSESLHLNGGLEYLDAKYTSFVGGTCSAPRAIGGAVLGGATSAACDLSGRPVVNSPKFSYSLGMVYYLDIPDGRLSLALNDAYKSGYAFVADGTINQKAYHNFSGSLNWKSPDERYDVQLFGKNLGGAYYYTSAQGAIGGSFIYTAGAPRTFGITLGYHL
ncbi:MAG: TonB-dependent receptor [Pseudomonadota bacterium]